MPSRKQRRRREKSLRHEYETVLLDEDGNEIPLDPDELRAEREAKNRDRAQAKPARGKNSRVSERGRRPARAPRQVPPPSWHRAFRRGGMMGGLMLVAFLFLFKSAPLGLRLVWGLFYAIAFIPLTYWIDRVAHRSYLRRTAAAGA